MKIFIGTMLTFYLLIDCVWIFAYKIYFPTDAENKSEIRIICKKTNMKKHNINNNGSEANEILIIRSV